MDISGLSAISGLTSLTGSSNLSQLSEKEVSEIYSAYNDTLSSLSGVSDENAGDFSSILDSMLNSVNETNTLQNQAEAASIQFALGEGMALQDI